MLLVAMRYQAFYGRCILSARRLAGEALANEKSWDRLLARLRELGLATSARNVRPDGKLGTNTTDLRGLWYRLVRYLGSLLFDGNARIYEMYKGAGYLLIKCRTKTGYHELVVQPIGPAPPRDISPPWPSDQEVA
jgi:hypothetical protein